MPPLAQVAIAPCSKPSNPAPQTNTARRQRHVQTRNYLLLNRQRRTTRIEACDRKLPEDGPQDKNTASSLLSAVLDALSVRIAALAPSLSITTGPHIALGRQSYTPNEGVMRVCVIQDLHATSNVCRAEGANAYGVLHCWRERDVGTPLALHSCSRVAARGLRWSRTVHCEQNGAKP